MAINFKSPVTIVKVAALILGAVSLGIGLYSYFESSWVKSMPTQLSAAGDYGGDLKFHQICHYKGMHGEYKDIRCPPIHLEYYYLASIIICFVMSLIIFIAGFFRDFELQPLILCDLGYHCISAVALITCGVGYIISAEKIEQIVQKQEWHYDHNFLIKEKFIAGSVTIVQGIMYGIVALCIVRI